MSTGHVLIEDQIGKVDNLNDPIPGWNRPSTIISMTLIFGAMSMTCMSLRLWTRYFVIRSPGWDDIFILLILGSGSIGTICMCLAPGLGGMGRHLVELSDAEQRNYFKLFYVADASFVTATALIKMCLLLQYLRIFTKGFLRYFCQTTFICVTAWGAVMSFVAWVPCFPVRAFWDWRMENRNCYGYGSLYVDDHYHTYLSHSIANMCLDFVILAIPTPLMFRKETMQRTRLGLGGLLIVGLIANILAALRLANTVQHQAMSYPTFDHPWFAPTLCMLGMLEINFACIGASVPVFWPVMLEKFDKIFVTHEINVSIADRDHSTMPQHLQRSESLYSHDGSESSARLWNSRNNNRNSTLALGGSGGGRNNDNAHYTDTYVMDQVDPLRQKTTLAVESVVTADQDRRPR